VYLSYPNRLEAGGYIQRISFTPTDALHVLGSYTPWNREAALLGATILGRRLGMRPEELAAHICGMVVDRIASEIIAQVAADEEGEEDLLQSRAAGFFLGRALHPERGSALGVSCHLRLPVAAVGAPVRAYFPQLASRLQAELLIPEHAEVANAIGAASGGVVQSVEVVVEPEYNIAGIASYRVYSSAEMREFATLEEALAYASEAGRELAMAAARRAGAEDIVVHEEQQDQRGSLAEPGDSLYLGTRLRFTAAGRPRLAATEVG
jgi:N-methylhydantoinase A/oxoprolinase/acetone carboxylase beta subunit